MEPDLLDIPVSEFAIVDRGCTIEHWNQNWEDVSEIGRLAPKPVRRNCIVECEVAIRRDRNVAESLAELRAFLVDKSPIFVATHACPFDALCHWFQVLISAFELNGILDDLLMRADITGIKTKT